jgi:hypothetical protein
MVLIRVGMASGYRHFFIRITTESELLDKNFSTSDLMRLMLSFSIALNVDTQMSFGLVESTNFFNAFLSMF